MNDHESNLYDLYAGFAMMAMVMRKDKGFEDIAHNAHEQAVAMLEERGKRRTKQEGGIADILSKWSDA
jgi:rubrerythrin